MATRPAAAAAAAAAALLFSLSAVVFLFLLLLAPPRGLAELLVSVLDRFLDGRALLELATRRNMILVCHAILLLILRDAGVLAVPASEATAAPARPHSDATRSAVVALTACSAAPARPHATRSAVVSHRRRPRNRAVVAPMHEHDATGRVVDVECWPVATWVAPVLTTGPVAQVADEAAAVASKQIVVVESPRNDDHHDRAAVVVEPLEHPTAILVDGERDCDNDRRIIAVAVDDKRIDDTAGEHQMAEMEMEVEMELADDRTFEEFIESQRRQMRQESLWLLRSDYHYQAMATCY